MRGAGLDKDGIARPSARLWAAGKPKGNSIGERRADGDDFAAVDDARHGAIRRPGM